MKHSRFWFFGAMAVSLFLAGAVSPYASTAPDGLEKVATGHGFSHRAGGIWKYAPMKGYGSPVAGKRLSAVIGTLAVFGVSGGLALLLSKKQKG